ncbi:hypothetical protein Rctr85_027 [Virus Rctr85]|nr:hypothetical protein Rctr85_027 [Virus Rctr85]
MVRPPLTQSQYMQAGREKGLEWIGNAVPGSVHTPTRWRCLTCRTIHEKSYRAVKYGAHGCTCQNAVTKKPEDYRALAELLGIEWAGMHYSNRVPKNTKAATVWIGRNGTPVEASYAQLAYGEISQQLRDALGLDEVTTADVE